MPGVGIELWQRTIIAVCLTLIYLYSPLRQQQTDADIMMILMMIMLGSDELMLSVLCTN